MEAQHAKCTHLTAWWIFFFQIYIFYYIVTPNCVFGIYFWLEDICKTSTLDKSWNSTSSKLFKYCLYKVFGAGGRWTKAYLQNGSQMQQTYYQGIRGRRIHWEIDTGMYTLLHIKQVRVGNGNPLQYSCLENPMDRGDWQATVHGFADSWTQVKQLSI